MSETNKRCKECMKYAKTAIRAHAKAVGNEDEELEIQVRDLLADLMHLCKIKGVDFEYNLRSAKNHFTEECLDHK